jgi:hypothetical protein
MILSRLRALLLLLLFTPLLATGEDKAAPADGAPKKRRLTAAELREFYTDPAGRIVTEWTEMDRDTKIWRSFTKAGYSTVLSEGKMEDGQMLFRKAYKHLGDVYPDAERPKWYTYNGMDPQFFEERNRELLKEGYTLMQMQRFIGDEGEFRFCGIWVKFVPPLPKK